MPWSTAFYDPIELPDGHTLRTLADAGHYIAALPRATQRRPEWQAAAQALLLVAESGGDAMLARIGIMRALYPGPAEPTARRKRAKSYKIIR